MNIRNEAMKSGAVWGTLVLFMLISNPSALPVYVLFVPFMLFGLAIYRTWRFFLAVYTRRTNRQDTSLTRKQRIGGTVVTAVAVILLGLESLGEMTVRDFITVIVFAIGAYFYFARNIIRE
jgi:hypothetical protein